MTIIWDSIKIKYGNIMVVAIKNRYTCKKSNKNKSLDVNEKDLNFNFVENVYKFLIL